MKKTLILFFFLNLPFLIYGIKTPQKNPEELFLSDHFLKEIKEDKNEFSRNEVIFVSKLKNEDLDLIDEIALKHDLTFSNLSLLIKDFGSLEIPEIGEKKILDIFNELKLKLPHLKFAGDAFTNSELALMTNHIQDIIFPVVFGIIFLGLLVIVKNLIVSLFIFLTSLLGASLGLFWVKFLFSHSTILTTLTPLIGFVLTLGAQFHVVYGLNTFKKKEVFYVHKLKPILLMMITTIIGFMSLFSSDLESIRQLALSVSLTLITTWGTLLVYTHFFTPKFNFDKSLKLNFKIKKLKISSLWGNLFLMALFIGGIVGLNKMPILVDAVQFFSQNHPVQSGYREISNKLGGTPQFEVVVSKLPKSPLEYEDFLKIEKIEDHLGGHNFLTLIGLIKKINKSYSGSEKLPDNSYAFYALLSKIPESLKSKLLGENSYKIIYIEKSLSTEDREKITSELVLKLKNNFSDFNFKITGLMHFLLESQKDLVLSLVKSFILSFLFISLIFALSTRDFKQILNFCLINSASVLGGLFLMWITGMTLNVSTVMTVSISMGLVVDSTIHLLHSDHLGEDPTTKYDSNILPIIFSHIILFVAFGILSLESFLPVGDFSKGLLILLLLGLFCDLYVLPIISSQGNKQV